MSGLRDTHVAISMQDNATSALNNINRLMDRVGNNFQRFGNNVDGSTSGFRNIYNEVNRLNQNLNNSTQEITQLNRRLSDSESEMNGLRQESRRLESELRGARDEIQTMEQRLSRAEQETADLREEMRRVANETNRAEKSVGFFGSTLGKVAGLMGAVFAVDQIKDFGMSAIQEAAGVQAMGAQFEQVFGEVQGLATKTVDEMADSFGMVNERLTPAFTQMTSMFKGLGLDTTKAMEESEKAVTIAADAAAFYDKSYEDANGALNSFIKGNYEGGESIGLFGNETQLAAWAAKELKVDWKKLGEADKQMGRLKFAQTMQAAAGATGQAARESDAYENQLGNFQQAWTNLKAKVGGPLLEPFVQSMKSASQWMEGLDTDALIGKIDRTVEGFGAVKDTVMSLVNNTGDISGIWQNFGLSKETSDSIEGFAEFMKAGFVVALDIGAASFDGIKDRFNWVIDNKELVTSAATGIAAGFMVMKGISVVSGLLAVYQASTFAATMTTHGFNAALRANPIGLVVTGIGLLVAAGVYLYQNWDTVKLKAGELWTTTKEKFAGIKSSISDAIQPAIGWFINIKEKWDTFKSSLSSFKMPEWMSSIGGTISSVASKVSSWGSSADGSHATGLASVPYDGYMAELHKDEPVLTAKQGNALRSAGILSANSDGTPNIDLSSMGSGAQQSIITSVAQGPMPLSGDTATSSSTINDISVTIPITIYGNPDDSAVLKLQQTLDTKVRAILEQVIKGQLEALEG